MKRGYIVRYDLEEWPVFLSAGYPHQSPKSHPPIKPNRRRTHRRRK